MTNEISRERMDAGQPRFGSDEGNAAPVRSGREALFCKKYLGGIVCAGACLTAQAFVKLNPVPAPTLAEPVYTITVADGETVEMGDWLKENAPSFGTAGTFVKEGLGTLVVTNGCIKDFAGDIHIKAGRWWAKSRTALGTTAGQTWVDNGAVLDMFTEKAYSNTERIYERVYLSGTGPDGKGALVSSGNNYGQVAYLWPSYITLLDNSKINCDASNGACRFTSMYFNLNGCTCTWNNAGWDWAYVDNGVVSNGCVRTTGYTYLYQGACFKGGAENVLTFASGSGYRTYNNTPNQNDANASWTQVYEDGSKIYASGGTSGWSGPVILRGGTALECQNLWTRMVFWGPVSGPGNIGSKSSGSSFSGFNCCSVILRLHCPTNSFTGGVNLRYNVLEAMVDGAVPAAGGKLTALGSTVKLMGQETYSLPPAEFTGTGVVQGASGVWRTRVVKKDAGELVYDSRVGAPLLDLQGGSVRVVATANTGLWEYVRTMTTGTAAERQTYAQTYYAGRETPQNNVNAYPDMMYSNVYSSSKRWGDYMTVVYSGYLWNKTDADVTWTFAQCYDDESMLYINDTLVAHQNGYQNPSATAVTLHPGANRFELRIYNVTGGGGSSTYQPSGASMSWQSRALSYCEGSTSSKDPGDYTPFTTATAAQYFTPTDGTVDGLQALLPQFDTIKLAAGTVFDSAGLPYRLATVEGVGAFTNGALIVTNTLALAAADVNARRHLTVSGKLTLTAGCVIDVPDPDSLQRSSDPIAIATAAGGVEIEGRPVVSARLRADHWFARRSEDGLSIVIWHQSGTSLIVR